MNNDDPPIINDEFVPYKDYDTPNLPAEKDDIDNKKSVTFKK